MNSHKLNPRKSLGLLLLVTVILTIILFQYVDPGGDSDPISTAPTGPDEVTVNGIFGGKVAFMQDPAVVQFLKEKYGLTVTFKRVPSFDQIDQCVAPLDFCWPSSQTAGDLIEDQLGSAALDCETIFNSPIVLYTWTPIADALVQQGIVVQRGDTLYLVDLAKLVQLIDGGVLWSEIGLPDQFGSISMRSSDPTTSNTGNSFAGLLANTYNGIHVVRESTVDSVLPRLITFVDRMGLIPDTTTEMFEQFFTLGRGAAPIIVAYESNLIEYSLSHPSPIDQAYIRANVRTLYPEPTVWSSQPMCALTANGQRLIDAMRDPELQLLAWEHHGFRTAVPGVTNDPATVPLAGVPAEIVSVIQMPEPAVIMDIIEALKAPATVVNAGQATPTAVPMPPLTPVASLRPMQSQNWQARRMKFPIDSGA